MSIRSVVPHFGFLLLAFGLACAAPVQCPAGYCGTIVVLQPAPTETLFPPTIRTAGDIALAELLFLPLAEIGPELNTTDDLTFLPRLASSWAFEDSLTLVFNLNPDARWHDGTAVTARDVEFTFAVYTDTLIGSISARSLESIESVIARGDSSVEFTFNRYHPEQFYTATYHMRVLPSHVLDSIPRDRLSAHDFASNPVGSGPYRFGQWSRGQFIELWSDTTFFLGRPDISRVMWRHADDANTIMSSLLSQDADFIELLNTPENVEVAVNAEHLNVIRYPANHYGYMAFNMVMPGDVSRPHLLFSDPRVRLAISMSVDRDRVAMIAQGPLARAPDAPITPINGAYQAGIPAVRYDTVGARMLLQDAGWSDQDGDGVLERNGQPLSFNLLVPTSSPARMRGSAVIKSLLSLVGIEANVVAREMGVFMGALTTSDFDMYVGAWGLQPSLAGFPALWTSAGVGGQNFGRYQNPTVDSLVDAALSEHDASVAARRWSDTFIEMNRDPAALWLYTPVNMAAIHERFENVSLRGDRWSATLWQWRIRRGEWLARDVVSNR